MQTIALTGYPRCGKDTVSDIFKDLLGETVVRNAAFADQLKLDHMREIGIQDINTYNHYLHMEIPYNNINLRTGLVELSTLQLKDNPFRYTQQMHEKITTTQDCKLYIITDLRYPVEYAYIRDYNIPIVRVHRHQPQQDILNKPWNKHVASFVTDYDIDNTRTLEDLLQEVTTLARGLKLSC